MARHKHECIACGEHNEGSSLYCSACGNYLPRDYFEYLGVTRDADTKAIRNAFLKRAIECRPEKSRHLSPALQKLAAQKLERLNEIWEILGDEHSRREYLVSLHQEERLAEPSQQRKLGISLWRRWCARYIDYLLFATLLSPLLQVLYPGLFEDFLLGLSQGEYLKLMILTGAITMAVISAWVPFEAIFLSTAGATPGKWLLQIRLVGADQQKLHFVSALARAMEVWSLGMGLGLFAFIPCANGFWYVRSKQGKSPHWDKQRQHELIEQPLSIFRVAASSLIAVQSLALAFFMMGPLPSGDDIAYALKFSLFDSDNPEHQPVSAIEDLSKPTLTKTSPTGQSDTQGQSNNPVGESALEPDESTGIVLPPGMRETEQTTLSLSESATSRLPKHTVSKERRIECVQHYEKVVAQAKFLPLGDYARINRRATEQRDRCLRGEDG